MSEQNKAIVRRFLNAIIKNDQSTLREVMSPDLVYHHHQMGDVNRDTHLQGIAVLNQGLSDMQMIIEDQMADADKVTSRYLWRAVHTGEFLGFPASNKQFTISGISIERIADGKIVERWVLLDELGMMQQLGIIQPQ